MADRAAAQQQGKQPFDDELAPASQRVGQVFATGPERPPPVIAGCGGPKGRSTHAVEARLRASGAQQNPWRAGCHRATVQVSCRST
jgi:hypothetical protein